MENGRNDKTNIDSIINSLPVFSKMKMTYQSMERSLLKIRKNTFGQIERV